ncbi:hypothetical protein ACIA3K_03500 [Micromonospora sp. NPDC051543]|uniref:hypothetical protein n=1 Tax=Micromonospora sp. NPDC051543 TaxID=3364287 RepID=UPI0037ACAA59
MGALCHLIDYALLAGVVQVEVEESGFVLNELGFVVEHPGEGAEVHDLPTGKARELDVELYPSSLTDTPDIQKCDRRLLSAFPVA